MNRVILCDERTAKDTHIPGQERAIQDHSESKDSPLIQGLLLQMCEWSWLSSLWEKMTHFTGLLSSVPANSTETNSPLKMCVCVCVLIDSTKFYDIKEYFPNDIL